MQVATRAATATKVNLLPEEFTARYHQQFVDRLWLRGLAYIGVAYAVLLAFYFCATAGLGYRTTQAEGAVAKISNDYTNALQLKAVYDVLKERSQLKYAALDSWQWVAQELPPVIALQRFSFADGQHVEHAAAFAAGHERFLPVGEFDDGDRTRSRGHGRREQGARDRGDFAFLHRVDGFGAVEMRDGPARFNRKLQVGVGGCHNWP